MDAEHHDKVLAMTSHLPHLIAYTIVGTATDLEDDLKSEVIKFSAGGFRDFTRIAASDPVMWRDIFLNNREAVLEMLQRFSEDLTALQRAIRWGEGDKLEELLHPHPRDPPLDHRGQAGLSRRPPRRYHTMRGAGPSLAGPRNIWPFWIVNEVRDLRPAVGSRLGQHRQRELWPMPASLRAQPAGADQRVHQLV